MDDVALVEALSRPQAWPGAPDEAIEVRHTHISAVFLVGDRAFKLKKAVDLGFLDFTTLERRRWFCEEEVRINRRYAPGIYRGVVPVMRTADGVRVGGEGEVVDWLVEMVRLDDEDTLAAHLDRHDVPLSLFERLGRRVAVLHAEAERSAEIAAFGRHEVVARNATENFEQTGDQVGVTVSRPVWERLRERTEAVLHALEPTIDGRAARGVPCDTHGDLRLEHVYLLDGEFVILDAIEFNERFRYADPVADLAFLYMDLACRGLWPEASTLAEAWIDATGDDEASSLLPFYVAYRSVVRAKVAGFKLEGLSGDAWTAMRDRARMHWLYALATLDVPESRPCLVAVEGLPGTGKTSLAFDLADAAGFEVVRSDVVRKSLAHLEETQSARTGFESGLYTPQNKDRVYRECLDRAEALLLEGRRVIVDASFGRESWRSWLLDRGEALGVPVVLLRCDADPDVVRERLSARRDDASDADWPIYLKVREQWEPHGARTRRTLHAIDTGLSRPAATRQALGVLIERGLARPPDVQ